jgi:hypothetical protein
VARGVVAYGDRQYFYLDVSEAQNSSNVLLEMKKKESLSFPMLVVKKGGVPDLQQVWNIQGAFRNYSGNSRASFREHSRNIHKIFGEA